MLGKSTANSKDCLFLYLSGSIKKGNEDGRTANDFWTDEEEHRIIEGIAGLKVKTLNPAKSNIKRADYYGNFGCDLYLVAISDIILVDARTKKGIGVGAEMLFAQIKGIRVITICPPNSNYRRDFIANVFGEDLENWIHPFVYGLSDHIVDDIDGAIELINHLIENGLPKKEPLDLQKPIDYHVRVNNLLQLVQDECISTTSRESTTVTSVH
jgi:hypothetical protein